MKHPLAQLVAALSLACCAATPSTRPATLPANVSDAKGLDAALDKLRAPMRESDPLPPAETLKRFKPRDGLAVDLIASEPDVRQPLHLTFDERGRMWVTQYVQYPFPAGLKVTEYDQYIRAKFDRVPPPPPHAEGSPFRGADKITIHEDTDGDGSFDKVKTFVDGLSIATASLPGNGGVWVMNPPYLLFYPDANRDDVPDGPPVVHLSGFGLEDTHAVANSLTWGPDGWIYGCQGSTCTAKVKVEIRNPQSEIRNQTTDFLGQAIWRYHPTRHTFELFAEGGGNTFGVEFDDAGNLFSGTNWGKYRGLHYVQGGYYVKGWGKHGPLTNPHAYGFFEHMPHTGNADRLAHTFVVYGGGLLGKEYDGKILSPNSLQSRLQVTRLEPVGSTFKTAEEEPFLLTCDDGWFRPVDLKVGPDGALYVADFYEKRISHVDPRDTWDRSNGRIWRVRPEEWRPGVKPFDLARLPDRALVDLLSHPNRWHRAAARRILAGRTDDEWQTVSRALQQRVNNGGGTAALEALLAQYAFEDEQFYDRNTFRDALRHPDPVVRTWAVRLSADRDGGAKVHGDNFSQLRRLAHVDFDARVRGALAVAARRFGGTSGSDMRAVILLSQLTWHEADADDPYIPLLLWWALEGKAVADRDGVMDVFENAGVWGRSRVVREHLMPRLARRYAAEPTTESQAALAKLLDRAPGEDARKRLLDGVKEAFAGSTAAAADFSPQLRAALTRGGDVEIGLRLGDARAHETALRVVADETKAASPERLRYVELLGQVGKPEAAGVLLGVAERSKSMQVRRAALLALARFDDADVGRRVVAMYPKLPAAGPLRSAAIGTLLARPAWTAALLEAVSAGSIARSELTAPQVAQVRQYEDAAVSTLADRVFGKLAKPSSDDMRREVDRVKRIVTTGAGDATAGKAIFAQRCAACHTLFGEGGKVGPDLTGYERRNADFLVISTVDPSAAVREEYTSFRVKTKDGQSFVGLVTEREAGHLALVDAAQQRTVVAKDQIAEERALPTSVMPDGLLAGLSDQELRDLFKYLSLEKPATAAGR